MEASRKSIPGYVKYFFILANILLTCFVLVTANFIISPLLAALIIAIILNPLYHKLTKFGIPRILSAGISIFLFLLTIIILISFITRQLAYITTDPNLSTTVFTDMINASQSWLTKIFNFSLHDQAKFIENSLNNFIKNIVAYVPNAFTGTAGYLSMLILFFISLFFFLYYRAFFTSFILKLFGKGNEEQVKETVGKIEEAVKEYIVGLFIVISIVSILNSLGLLLIGIDHAIFFGILGALLTIIPYFGIVIGSLLPALFALLSTGSIWFPIMVILVFSFVQFLEGNFITPNIIGSRENINPYVAILGLFVGGMLLGTIGVVLAIPLLGIIKIICDDIDSLKPIGYVLGHPGKNSNIFSKWISKFMNLIKPGK